MKKFLSTFIITYLPIFSFGIFGPSEIYFGNIGQFGVIYSEFGWKFLGIGTLIALVLAAIITFLPEIVRKIILSVFWIVSICGYVQVMFLNKGIDSIGMTTEGYIPTTTESLKSGIVWLVLIVIAIVILIKAKKKWCTVAALVSLVLVATQAVAYGSLFIGASEEAFVYEEGSITLDGSKQYEVSSQGNIIVIILDTVCNDRFNAMYETNQEEMAGPVKDFTYFNNCDCSYWGTYPSIEHLVTGNALDTSLTVNEWMVQSWDNERTNAFYDGLHANGYKIHLYTPETWLVLGTNDGSILEGKIDNLTTTTANVTIHHDELYRILLKMSGYRMMTNCFKPYFDVPNSEYLAISTKADNVIDYMNTDFYASFTQNGLTTTDESKYLIYYHLNGIHELTTDENCQPIDANEGTIEGTMLGMWKMLDEFFDELKAVGAYDNSTIIITADHGSLYDTQSIFFIKQPFETHEAMGLNRSMITLHELMPTIGYFGGVDTAVLGEMIYDYDGNTSRKRTVLARDYDASYPDITRFQDGQTSNCNVWRAYTYEGDWLVYYDAYYGAIYSTIPMVEGY